VYWLTLAVLGAAGIGTVREFFWWNWAFLGNFMLTARQIFPADTSHLWSLAVEEQFYLVWPLLLLFLPRRHLPAAMIGLAVFAPLFRWYCLTYFSPWHATLLMPACLDVLGLGGILAWLFRERAARPERYRAFTRVAALAGGAGSLLHVTLYLQSDSAWITAWPLARTSYALLFVALVARGAEGFSGGARRLAEWRPLVHLGMVSYAVYLFHPFAGELLRLGPPVRWLAAELPVLYFGVQVALTVAVATVSWRLLEQPVNAFRHAFPYVGGPAARSAA
jgi:peptidoglycan/LPS O-acetylase OafA/YrhL